MTTPQPAALPELPLPDMQDDPQTADGLLTHYYTGGRVEHIQREAFDAGQAYALAALQSQPAAAGVSDDAIDLVGNELARKHAVYLTRESVRDLLARAILALRPQADTLCFELSAMLGCPPSDTDVVACVSSLLTPRQQAVPMTDEPFLKVHKGAICYKSDADDQSYGMWCPVNWDTEHGLKDGTVFYAHHGITAQGAQGGEG